MKPLLGTTIALAAAMASIGASAQYHHICFEGASEVAGGKRIRTIIAACQDDHGAACTVRPSYLYTTGQPNQIWPFARQPVDLHPAAGNAYRELLFFRFDGDARIEFEFGGGKARRGCVMRQSESWAPRGRLTGFSTDASGLVSTGVWRFHAEGGWSDPAVPGGFVAVGGGSAADQPDAFVSRSDTGSGLGANWTAWTRRDLFNSPRPPAVPELLPGDRTFGYVVGARIGDLRAADLQRQLGRAALLSKTQPATAAPAATVKAPFNTTAPILTLGPDAAVLGGGVFASALGTGTRHVATASAPVRTKAWFVCVTQTNVKTLCPRPAIGGWHAEARSPQGVHADEVRADAVTLPWSIDVPDPLTGAVGTWRVRVRTVDALTRADVAPAGDVTGLRGEYAVTGAGAEVLWRGPTGNDPTRAAPMLSRIEPRPDLGGASAAAQAGSMSALAVPVALSVHAVGLRLVDPKTADEPEILPERISTLELCRADSALSSLPICQKAPSFMPPWQMCKEHPYLPKHGYCNP